MGYPQASSPFGLNIHVGYVQDWGKLLQRLDILRPVASIAYVDSPNQMSRVAELKARYPDTVWIVRVYTGPETNEPREGDYHLPGEGGGYVLSPVRFMDRFGQLGREGYVIHAQNEPTGYDNLQRLSMWHESVLRLADQAGVRIAGPGFGTGHPALDDDGLWTRALRPLLLAYGLRRSKHYLNIHEYDLADRERNQYLFGRFTRLMALCEAEGMPKPDIVIGEWGIDRAGPGTGYKGQGLDGAQYAHYLLEAYESEYRVWVDRGIIKALMIYCYGNSGGWDSFNVEPDDSFWDVMMNRVPRVRQPKPAPTPEPEPEPAPEPEPEQTPAWWLAFRQWLASLLRRLADQIA